MSETNLTPVSDGRLVLQLFNDYRHVLLQCILRSHYVFNEMVRTKMGIKLSHLHYKSVTQLIRRLLEIRDLYFLWLVPCIFWTQVSYSLLIERGLCTVLDG